MLGPLAIDKNFAGMRLDVYLAGRLADACLDRRLSRAEIQRLIAEGLITLNGARVKSSVKVKAHDRVDIHALPPRETDVKAQALPLEVIYEDGDCLVINKAPGMVVHPAAGRSDGTLVNALLHHCKDLAGIGGERRPGIVHRLDKDTSGVMIVAKNMLAFQHLVGQFKNRQVRKEYLALAWGAMVPARGQIDRPIGRHRSNRKRMSSLAAGNRKRTALTEWQVLEYFPAEPARLGCGVSFVRLLPHTGRTHQLRVHCADMGFPLVGDKLYGRMRRGHHRRGPIDSLLENFPRQALHAERLHITRRRGDKPMEFHAPLPPDMEALLMSLRRLNSKGGAPSNG